MSGNPLNSANLNDDYQDNPRLENIDNSAAASAKEMLSGADASYGHMPNEQDAGLSS
jgi:hypothetical protein